MIVRSCTGEDASEVSADQISSLAVGSTVTPSLARIAATHSADQARSAPSSMRAKGWSETLCSEPADRLPPRSCQSPPHGQGGGADRAAEVEGEYLGAGVAAELHRHQRQQHRLAGPGRADDQGVADIADMEREPERRGAFGLAEEERRPLKMVVAIRAGPNGRERDHMGQVQGADRRLAHIGVGVAEQRGDHRRPSLGRTVLVGPIVASGMETEAFGSVQSRNAAITQIRFYEST